MCAPLIKIRYVVILLLTACCISSCVAPYTAEVPELLPAVSIREDMAKVTRGRVENVNRYGATVRIKSQGLFFRDTGLRFGEYYCVPGDYVEEGQLLARLNTEAIERQIATQLEKIEHIVLENAFAVKLLELEIDRMLAELELLAASVDQDRNGMAVELKKLDIEHRQLALDHVIENQNLSLAHEENDLRNLQARIADAEIRAPFDGIITYRADKSFNQWVAPFSQLIFISGDDSVFVEFTGTGTFTISSGHIIKGAAGQNLYDLERLALSVREATYFTLMRIPQPLRFSVKGEHNLTPGEYMTLYVYTDIRENVLRLPVNTIYTDDIEIGPYVYVLENGSKTMRQIETGLVTAAFVEIISGLSEGDEVFVRS